MWRNSIIAAHRRIVEARVPRNIQERRCSGWVTVLECDRVLKESPCNNQHNSAQINSLLEFVLVTLSLQEIFMKKIVSGFALSVLLSSTSIASPVTFFGEDLSTGDPNIGSLVNATTARNNFFSNLTGVGTETFDSYASTPASVSFGAAGTATLSGGTLASLNDGAGRFPVSGSQYLNASTSNFSLSFSNPISAFGFFGTDVGDFGGQLSLTLTGSNGVTQIVVPHTIGSGGSTSGSDLYFGFYDLTNTYTSITFDNPSTVDVFAFDNLSIGARTFDLGNDASRFCGHWLHGLPSQAEWGGHSSRLIFVDECGKPLSGGFSLAGDRLRRGRKPQAPYRRRLPPSECVEVPLQRRRYPAAQATDSARLGIAKSPVLMMSNAKVNSASGPAIPAMSSTTLRYSQPRY
jgi:hypothetical protein